MAACSIGVRYPPGDPGGPLHACTDSYARPVADAVAAIALGVATVVGFKTGYGEDCGAIDCLVLPFGAAATLVVPFAAAHGFYTVHSCRKARRESANQLALEAETAKRAASRERAWQITKRAAAAARMGDCVPVRDASSKVREHDEALHATVFVRDVAIARCLTDAP